MIEYRLRLMKDRVSIVKDEVVPEERIQPPLIARVLVEEDTPIPQNEILDKLIELLRKALEGEA